MAIVLTNGEYYISYDRRTGGITKTDDIMEAQVFCSCNAAMEKVFKAPGRCRGYYPYDVDDTVGRGKIKAGRKKYSKEERRMVYNRAGGCCKLCGQRLLLEDMTLDHIVPLSMGGRDELGNLQAAHRECNQFKSNILPEEFLGRVAEVFIYQMDISHGGSVMWGIVRGMLKKLV